MFRLQLGIKNIITMPKIFIFKKVSNKRAFSLIELSIVVVIIGLLIAGITSGRNLVKASKLSSGRSVTLSSQIVTIPGMVLWAETTTKDAFLNTQSINSNQLTTWYNIEPSGFLVKNNLTTAASANVVYKEVSTNELPALNMTVAGRVFVPSFSGAVLPKSTIVIVFKPTIAPSGEAVTIADSGASANLTSSIAIRNNRVDLNAGLAANSSTVTNPASFSLNGEYILMVYFNGTSSKVFVNNMTEVGGSGAVLNAGTNALNGLTIGSKKSRASGISAEISEVIVYDRVLKSTERQDVMGYLSKKYKIPVTGL